MFKLILGADKLQLDGLLLLLLATLILVGCTPQATPEPREIQLPSLETKELSKEPTSSIKATPTITIQQDKRSPATLTPSFVASSTLTKNINPVRESPTVVPSDLSTRVSGVDNVVMAFVSGGKFVIGDNEPQEELSLWFGEDQTRVDFSLDILEKMEELPAYWIDRTEVTNRMYALCVGAGECAPPNLTGSWINRNYYGNPEYDDYPVVHISRDQAEDYCRWAGRRLPSEAEWEKAARGTDGLMYPWGNTAPTCDKTNFNLCIGDTTKVGVHTIDQSPYGAYDMAGNVQEWVSDWFEVSDELARYQVPEYWNVYRGGNFAKEEVLLTHRCIGKSGGMIAEDLVGFRCASDTD